MGIIMAGKFSPEVTDLEKEYVEAVEAHVENPGFIDAPVCMDSQITDEEQNYIDALTCFTVAESMLKDAKEIYAALDNAVEKLIKLKGVNFMFQLPDGPVVKLQEAKGRYVEFKKYEFVRTKRADESKGTLSVKEAQEMGFKV